MTLWNIFMIIIGTRITKKIKKSFTRIFPSLFKMDQKAQSNFNLFWWKKLQSAFKFIRIRWKA